MSQPEFVRVNGQTVRVTSLKRDETSGRVEIVIVARGSIAAQALADLGSQPTLELEIADEPTGVFAVTETDFRSTGDGEQSMNRIRFTLDPVEKPDMKAAELESQLDRIERKLDELLARIDS